jgi:DNA-binding NtrC family response regulator
MNEILLVEDNDDLRNIVKEALDDTDYSVTACASAEEAYPELKEKAFDLVITDLKLPEDDGIAVLEAARRENPATEVIIVTAYGTVDTAVNAMKKGATDFITKPFSIDQIRLQVLKILKAKKVKDENSYLRKIAGRRMIGAGDKTRQVLELAEQVAGKDVSVLILGESGTGKELIAEEIHRKSGRRDFPLIKVNCAALAPGVLESELFGHEKGAYTDAVTGRKGRFELADKGTIFLDEIADLPKELQVKLLRILQEKEFERVGGEKTIKTDARVIAATNRDIKAAVKDGSFREDLYYRLNVVEIILPPLREHAEDIPALIDHFLKKYAEYGDYRLKGISAAALNILTGYDYPGNVRELENLIQRILVTCKNEIIQPEDLPFGLDAGAHDETHGKGLEFELAKIEKKMISDAMNSSGGNKARAAEQLNVNRTTFMAKLKKYSLG